MSGAEGGVAAGRPPRRPPSRPRTGFSRSAAAGLLLLLAGAGLSPAWAEVTVVSESPSAFWEKTLLCRDADPHFVAERFFEAAAHHEPEIVAAFGGAATPHSRDFLLHHGRSRERATRPNPVILVPGAGLSATSCFGDTPFGRPGPSLAATLAADGFAVFAVTFAHSQGDNLFQAAHLASAIKLVLAATGARQADLVAESKGAFAARIYVSDLGRAPVPRYRGDVRRLVLLGSPSLGVDIPFAYPNVNYWVLENRFPAPLAFTRLLYGGCWVEAGARSIYAGGGFPGQAQMLHRWDRVYGLVRGREQVDVLTTYEGGDGAVSRSLGIERAIRDGGRLVEALDGRGVDPRVSLAVLAGLKPYLASFGSVGERRGPSDGVLLAASALATGGLCRRGAAVIRVGALYLNHFETGRHPLGFRWIEEALLAEGPGKAPGGGGPPEIGGWRPVPGNGGGSGPGRGPRPAGRPPPIPLPGGEGLKPVGGAPLGEPEAPFGPPRLLGEGRLALGGPVRAVAFSPEGKTLAAACAEGGVWLVPLAAPSSARSLAAGHLSAASVAFSPSGALIASGGDEGRVALCEAATGRLVRAIETSGGNVFAVAFAPDGESVLAGGLDGVVRVFEVSSGRLLRSAGGHEGPLEAIAVAPGGRRAASAGWDRTVRVFPLAAGASAPPPLVLRGHSAEVTSLAFAPDGEALLSGGYDGKALLFDLGLGKIARALFGTDYDVSSVALARDGGLALVASPGDQALRLFDLRTGAHRGTIRCERPPSRAALGPDGKTIVTGNFDGTITVYDARPPAAPIPHNDKRRQDRP